MSKDTENLDKLRGEALISLDLPSFQLDLLKALSDEIEKQGMGFVRLKYPRQLTNLSLQFKKELMAESPYREPQEIKLQELAKSYHADTEAFDRICCSGRTDKGVAVPVDPHEQAKIARNAQEVLKNLVIEAERIGLNRGMLLKAIRDYRP